MNFEIAPKSTEIQANRDEAILYCLFLAIGGKTGWRLPTKEELNQIYQSEKNFRIFGYYWSATDHNGANAWNQYMSNENHANFSNVNLFYVRAVRDI